MTGCGQEQFYLVTCAGGVPRAVVVVMVWQGQWFCQWEGREGRREIEGVEYCVVHINMKQIKKKNVNDSLDLEPEGATSNHENTYNHIVFTFICYNRRCIQILRHCYVTHLLSHCL